MDENIFGDIFGNLHRDSIPIRQYNLDSFYGGTSLKKVFERIITQDETSYLPEQEAFVFINYHMRPWLMELFELTFKYLVFVTFEIEFKKILDESQTMTILSSFRNQSWLQPTNLDHNYITNIVDDILSGFSNQFVQDVEDLQLRTESGWTFSKILSGNIVHIRTMANTLMTTYGKGAKPKLEFHPKLKGLFRYNIYDPIRLTPHKFNNNCVLISILIQLEYIRNGTLGKTTKGKIKNLLQCLYQHTGYTNFDDGVTIEQFKAIEDNTDLFSKLKQFYPEILANFEGLSLNLYTCRHSDRFRAFHLIPIRLGDFFSSRLNIDLLRDSNDIRPPLKKSKKNKKKKKITMNQQTASNMFYSY